MEQRGYAINLEEALSAVGRAAIPGILLPLLSMVESWPDKVNRQYRAIWLVDETACVAGSGTSKMERVGGNRATGARWLLFPAPWLAVGSSRLMFSWWLRLRSPRLRASGRQCPGGGRSRAIVAAGE